MNNAAGLRAVRLMPPHITAILVACLVLILGSGASLVWNVRDIAAAKLESQQASSTLDDLRALQIELLAAESTQRGYLLTGEATQLDAFERTRRDVASRLGRLAAGGGAEPLARVRTSVEAGMNALSEAVTLAAGGRPEQGLKLVQAADGRRVLEGAEQEVAALARFHHDRLLARADLSSAAAVAAARVAIAIDLLAVAAILLLGLYILRNVQRRHDAEAGLRAANDTLEAKVATRTQQLSQLSRHLLQVAETEKAALANELHDELGSNLTAINLDVTTVMQRLKTSEPALAERLRRSLELLHETLDIKRRLIQGLRPSMLDSLGLCPAIRMHCEDFTRRTNLPCDVDCPDKFPAVDPAWSIALFRVAQEALNNIAKYADAKRVQLELRAENGGAVLRVTDDGIGIPADAADKPMSHGLLGMRERMAQLGGRLSVTPGESGRGTVVDAYVPFPPGTN
ncbi:MAG: CHASE3 domain-containing protein [Gammaproteobacteria bacterium]|nr:CHASE3 domain-containing protein [Gammaproteobacteria bacterium]